MASREHVIPACPRLFRKGGEARLHIERFIDAGVLNEVVEFESGIIAAARMGEDVLEGVHRSVSRERSRATPSRIPWMSATRMLQANLEYFNKLMTTPGSGALWRSEWQRYKKLLQVPHKRRLMDRPRRISDKEFRRSMYRLGEHALRDWEWLPIGGMVDEKQDLVPADKLRREYVRAIMFNNTFYSYTTDQDEERVVLVFEPISDRKKFVKAKTAVKRVVPVLAQYFNIFATREGGSLDVYPDNDAQVIDFFLEFPFSRVRQGLYRWDRCASDTQGCILLTEKRLAQPDLGPQGLLNLECPEILIIDELLRRGWRHGNRKEPHVLGEAGPDAHIFKYIPGRPAKHYLQCLISLSSLTERGMQSLHVGQPVGYYLALLQAQNPGEVQPGQRADFYQALVRDGGGDLALVGLALAPAAPLANMAGFHHQPGNRGDSDVIDESDSDAPPALQRPLLQDVDADPEGVRQVQAPPPRLAASMSASSSSSSSSTSSSDTDSSAPPDLQGPVDADVVDEDEGSRGVAMANVDYPSTLEGQPLSLDDFQGANGVRYKRLLLRCRLHPGCMKYRSISDRQCATLGPWEPMAFLAVWNRMATQDMTGRQHRQACKPSKDDMRAWLAEWQSKGLQ